MPRAGVRRRRFLFWKGFASARLALGGAAGSATGAASTAGGAACELGVGDSPSTTACWSEGAPSRESRQKFSTSSSPYASRLTPCLSGSPVLRPNCPICEPLNTFKLNVRLVVTRPVPWRRARTSSRRMRVGRRDASDSGIVLSRGKRCAPLKELLGRGHSAGGG